MKRDTRPEQGFVVWLTGLPASGKTTLAGHLADRLADRGVQVQILDSDELRTVLTPDPDYSQAERDWFYATMTYIGQLLAQNGVPVIIAATASRRHYREQARQVMHRFVEVYVRCSLQTCMDRDTKGIYAKAQSGAADTVPGIQVPYEPPLNPELSIDTEAQTAEAGTREILAWLERHQMV
jgi:adenylylsulfate kinase